MAEQVAGGRIDEEDSKGVQVYLLKSKYRCYSINELKLILQRRV